jgi:Carboxypeptidase regulatory-like domain/TonB dependent receptor
MGSSVSTATILAVFLALCIVVPWGAPTYAAQVGTAAAALNGTVRDPSGAVVPDAIITLINTQTSVRQGTRSNSSGSYWLVNISPGMYTLTVSKEGFSTQKEAEFSLAVNQTAAIDFTLRMGSVSASVEVGAQGLQIETSTSELGSVVGGTEVNALPLNGRNFTELMLLGPGMSPANASQNAGGGGIGNPIGSVVFPAVNGQTNRSNMFLLDGINNYGSIRDTYAVEPILDDLEEFKVQSHNDEAQFGQVLGGIVNLVTKSGTNSFHGDVWEFLRNDDFDARNFFAQVRTPLKQNQFGGAIGGPVILPHYNGRNKTFFYFSYEGFRNHSSSESLYLTPTSEQLAGDFSAVSSQIYNPYSNPGGAARQPFMCDTSGNPLPLNPDNTQPNGAPCNKIPTSLLNSTMLYYAKSLFPAPIDTGNPNFNGRDTTPFVIRQDQFSIRVDQQLGDKDRIFVRYTGAWQPDHVSGGFSGFVQDTQSNNYNVAANWTHTFGPSTVLELTFGRVSAQYNMIPKFDNVPANFLQQSGFTPLFYSHAGQGPVIPSVFISGYLGASTYIGKLHYSDIYEYKGDISKSVGKHIFRMGASYATDGWTQPFIGSEDDFSAFQTSDGNGNGGDALASMLLGIPGGGSLANIFSYLHGGKIIGTYFQDQWRITDKLTLNLGLRYDFTINPREGRASDGSDITGNFDFNNGTYVLQKPAPPCPAVIPPNTLPPPCIPGGVLPAHVVIAKNGKVVNDVYDNVQPRVGVAYRITPKIVMRAAYGRFFDNWAAVTQNQSNYTQLWPNNAGLGQTLNQSGTPTAFAQDPLNFGTGAYPLTPTPFTQQNYFTDPNLKNARSDQYNFGFQYELNSAASVTANYVGSHSTRIPDGITANTAVTPGPGDPQLRAPYPYIPAQGYFKSVGVSTYNSLQLSSQMRTKGGFVYQLAYTWSKVIDIGCDGYFSFCDVQDPYHISNDRGVAQFDLTHIFSASWVYPLPFGAGKKWDAGNKFLNLLVGNWQINGILSLHNGLPYDVQAPYQVANTNNWSGAERVNLVGNPYAGGTKTEPININAFALPDPFTFGNMGRNSLRSDWGRNLDLSIFRSFPLSESKRFEFRAEAFNLTNTPVFGIPDNNITDPNFGIVSGTANTERQLQLALKFYF